MHRKSINVDATVRYVLASPPDALDAVFNAVEAAMQANGVASNRRALRAVKPGGVTIKIAGVIAWAGCLTCCDAQPISEGDVDALVQIHAACATRFKQAGYTPKKTPADAPATDSP